MMLELLSGVLTVAAAAMAAAGEPKWVTYRSPSGFYSVDHPADWKVERSENSVNILPGDDSGAVTISAYVGGKPSLGTAKQLIAQAFGAHQQISPLVTVIGSGWKGVRQAFLDKSRSPHRELVVLIATSAAGMVIITWNEVSPSTGERAPVHGRIFDSLKLSKPTR